MLRPPLGNLGTREGNLTGFKPDRLWRPDIGLGHIPRALEKSASVRVRCGNSGVGFDSQGINTDTVVIIVMKSRRELESIKRKSVDRVPCTVPKDGRKMAVKPKMQSASGWCPVGACSLWHLECHKPKKHTSDRDLILSPKLLFLRRVCLAELMIFQVTGLTQESLGTGADNGKASEHDVRS